jgi:ATP-binding cassette subfamily B protein
MTSRLAILRKLMQRMLIRPLGLRGDVGLGFLEDAAGVAAGVVAPLLLRTLVDALGHKSDPKTLVWAIVLFVLAWSSPSLIAASKLIHTTKIVEVLSADLASALLRQHLPRLAVDKSGDGGLCVSLIERLPFSLQTVVDGLLWRALPLLVQTVASLVVVAIIVSPADILILVSTFGLYLLAADVGARFYGRGVAATQTTAAAVSSRIADVVHNAPRAVVNGAVDFELSLLAARSDARRRAGVSLSQTLAQMSAAQFVVLCFGLALTLWLSAVDVQFGRQSVGTFVLVQAYVLRLALPLAGLAITVRQSALAIETLADVFRLIGPDKPLRVSAEVLCEAGVRLDAISFHYSDGKTAVDDVSAVLQPGSVVALVGANGSGKSTLAQLMVGMFTPSGGRITIDGVTPTASYAALGRPVALYVPQFIGLFNRSLRDNLLYPPSCATEPDLIERLKAWRFYEDGGVVDLNMPVGDHGERLSGGQIQKLEMARLIGVPMSLLVLDESTSALDAASTQQIINAFRAALGRTVLVLVTHNVQLAAQADQVLFLRQGRLAGAGTHRSLLQRNTAYQTLWEIVHGST